MTGPDTERQTREAIVAMGCALLDEGLVEGTWGNVSVRLDADRMLITPSGADYRTLLPEQIAEVRLDDGSWTGPLKPSTERKVHSAVYTSRTGIGAVIHTHAPNASTVAAARREVPPILDDLAQICGPTVRCAAYALPSTRKIVRVTLRALKGRRAVLLANHGAVCLGRDLDEAHTCCRVLEKACRTLIEAEFLGGAKSINRVEAALMHQVYLRKYQKSKDRA